MSSYYSGQGSIPGLTDQQTATVEFALKLADPFAHDGLNREIYRLLGDSPTYNDAALIAAAVIALTNSSGVEVPTLFPKGSVSAAANQLLSAGAMSNGSGSVGATLSQIQTANSGLGASGGMKAN
jgi:hypothetical protein